ncbi:anthranilate synthase component I [Pontibacillus salicampi]|uniref:Anthranilate synthase component 1 n=1 Tax=Pontibacillus salicampi TaxID=1449801 RepID=A0ABV6LI99_9BACI
MKDIPQFLEESSTYQTIPITYSFYSDTLTPIQLFERLREDAVYLLESGDHTSNWSRYSFIGLHPFVTITEQNKDILVHDVDTRETNHADSLQAAFEETFDTLNVLLPEIPLPFQGGGVGFVSYDAISDMEKVPEHTENDLGLPHYHFLFCRTLVAFDHVKNTIHMIRYVRVHHEEGDASKVERYHEAVRHIEAMLTQLKEPGQSEVFIPPYTNRDVTLEDVSTNYEKEAYKRDVEKIKEYIREGDVFQAVLSQRFSKQITADGFQLYRVLRHMNPSPYMFYLTYEGYEVIGSSPERLIQVADKEIEIHPIAGTRKRGSTEEEDQALAEELSADEKEKAEHFMLVDLARNDVGRVAAFGTVQVPLLSEVTRFSRVMHMISKVTGELRDGVHPIQAFEAAFPAGTLSGAPKIRAMEILQELEPTARNLYGGGVVYFGFDGNLDSCIAIRTILLKDQVAYIQAGAGVVADSDPEKEWQETVNKASALLQTIEVAEEQFGSTLSLKEETHYA